MPQRDAPVVDAPAPDTTDATVDTDGDGIIDDDNCPAVMNADQHDEDGDAAGDACDPCPTIANEGTLNGDGDALPDACDPHPAAGGDTLELLQVFDQPSSQLPAPWVVVEGTAAQWTVNNDVLELVADGTNVIVEYNVNFSRQAMEVGFSLVPVSIPSGQQSYFTALVVGSDNALDYIACGARFDTNPAQREIYDFTQSSFATISATGTPSPPNQTIDYRYRFIAGPSDPSCVIAQNGNTFTLSGPTRVALNNRHVGFRARNIHARVRYVAVYRY
jgi:hypothetical protein